MEKPILYIDMDGVVVDFPEVEEEIPAVICEKCIEWCFVNQKHHSDFPGLFSHLLAKDGAIEAILTLMQKYSIFLLSSAPWDNISSWSDKRIWVERHLPMLGRKCLILSHRKDLHRGRFLIDDRDTMVHLHLVFTRGKSGFILGRVILQNGHWLLIIS